MLDKHHYESPLSGRYASEEISKLFSPQTKYTIWRQLWVALAKAQAELGLSITPEQIRELEAHTDQINFAEAARYEKQFQHDVVAHIHAYGDQCPLAKSVIHLGATSCYVTDNGDLIQMRRGLDILINKIKIVLNQLADFAEKHASLACQGYTHFQPAQCTTVGKRACLWAQEFLMDLQELNYRKDNLKFLGCKGATGTQASFLALFDQDSEKVEKLDQRIAELMGFDRLFSISGQTYTRKQDMQVLAALAGLAASAHKFATDVRLLAHLKELEEPFSSQQVGSSAMPYKRNPVLSERICSLARFLISLNENPAYTASLQWLERSLDDSANRRITIPEAFLTADAILNLLIDVTKALVVYPKVIERHMEQELPFMALENILMLLVKKGGDRQLMHEKLRKHSQEAGNRIKLEGESNDLFKRLLADSSLNLTADELKSVSKPELFVGRASDQVFEFINQLKKFN